jgi:PAS domain S-box-containing protein
MLDVFQGTLSLVNLYRTRNIVNALNGDAFAALYWSGKLKGAAKDQRIAIVLDMQSTSNMERDRYEAEVARTEREMNEIREHYPKSYLRDREALAISAREQARFFQAWEEIRDLIREGRKKEAWDVYNTKLMEATLARRKMEDYLASVGQERGERLSENAIHAVSVGIPLVWTILFLTVILGTGSFLLFISSVRRSNRELYESEERFRRVVEGSPVGIYIQTNGLFRYVNPAALTMFGAETADQIIGQTVLERIHPDDRAAVNDRIRIGKEERKSVPFLEEQYLRLDGTAFDVEVGANPFVFDGRDGAIVFARDITERKHEEDKRHGLEQQLRQAQKMEAVGKLAGGIAHDFNNLLMVIQSYTEMLQDSLPAHDRLRRNTQEIMKASDRAASLTRQMLAYSRKQILSPVVLDLNTVVDETAKMLKRLIGEDIDFRVSAAKSLWATKADPDQVVQVLMNLCVNARDAMPQGGTLTIATGNVNVEEGSVSGQEYVSPGEYVCLSVADTGTGISKDLQEKIFDPFFTTKEVGKGTGLGLATVYGIVKQSGGYVWGDSELGQGACFTIYLPRVKQARATDVPAKTEAQPQGKGIILVAEDEEALREAMCDYLRGLGYTVLAAGSGKEALSAASEHVGHIDLLITDLVMPKMSGRQLAQMLGSLRPDLKTICMSGYSDDAVLRHGIPELGATFLQKPFSLGTLARKVRDTLGPTETVQ